MTTDLREGARRLRNAVEPMAAGVNFVSEAHAGYEALGFDGSPVTRGGAARLHATPPMMSANRSIRGPPAAIGYVATASEDLQSW
jgi:hypothetical protein